MTAPIPPAPTSGYLVHVWWELAVGSYEVAACWETTWCTTLDEVADLIDGMDYEDRGRIIIRDLTCTRATETDDTDDVIVKLAERYTTNELVAEWAAGESQPPSWFELSDRVCWQASADIGASQEAYRGEVHLRATEGR